MRLAGSAVVALAFLTASCAQPGDGVRWQVREGVGPRDLLRQGFAVTDRSVQTVSLVATERPETVRETRYLWLAREDRVFKCVANASFAVDASPFAERVRATCFERIDETRRVADAGMPALAGPLGSRIEATLAGRAPRRDEAEDRATAIPAAFLESPFPLP